MNKKLKVVVLMGGKSSEHEVSIASGNEVLKNLDKRKYNISTVVISKNGRGFENILKSKTDIVFIAMHGKNGEDGTIQGMLELIGIPYTGSKVLASAIGMDKEMFRKVMISENLPIPKSVVLGKKESFSNLKLYPYFVKPVNGGSSVGASIARNKIELKKSIELAFKYDNKILVDEYIRGSEFTCAVLGNDKPFALPVIEIKPLKGDFFDFDSKYTESGSEEIVPAKISKKLTKEIQELSIKVYKAIGCRGFGRVDFILKSNVKPVILEINTIPGLTPMSLLPKSAKAYGLSYSELLDTIIKYANE